MAAPTCGRPTKVCAACRHHLRCHTKGACQQYEGERQPCKNAEPDSTPCSAFAAAPCTRTSLMLNGCCPLHGGKSPKGVAHGNYKGKDYSIYLPKRQAEIYASLRDDPQRLTLEREIDLLRMGLAEVLRRMYDAEDALAVTAVRSGASEVRKHYQKARDAGRSGDAGKLIEAMTLLGDAVDDLQAALSPLAAEEEGRERAVRLSLALDRLLRTENTVKLAERGMVTLEAVMARDRAMIDAWKAALDQYVRDVETRQKVLVGVSRIYADTVGRREAPALAAGGEPVVLDAELAATDD